MSDSKARLDARSGVTGWRLHDLRRTARSLMSRAGVLSEHADEADNLGLAFTRNPAAGPCGRDLGGGSRGGFAVSACSHALRQAFNAAFAFSART
jgi:hypothetical protein